MRWTVVTPSRMNALRLLHSSQFSFQTNIGHLYYSYEFGIHSLSLLLKSASGQLAPAPAPFDVSLQVQVSGSGRIMTESLWMNKMESMRFSDVVNTVYYKCIWNKTEFDIDPDYSESRHNSQELRFLVELKKNEFFRGEWTSFDFNVLFIII